MMLSETDYLDSNEIYFWTSSDIIEGRFSVRIYFDKKRIMQAERQMQKILSKNFSTAPYNVRCEGRKTLFLVEVPKNQINLFLHAIIAGLPEAEIGSITLNNR